MPMEVIMPTAGEADGSGPAGAVLPHPENEGRTRTLTLRHERADSPEPVIFFLCICAGHFSSSEHKPKTRGRTHEITSPRPARGPRGEAPFRSHRSP